MVVDLMYDLAVLNKSGPSSFFTIHYVHKTVESILTIALNN